VMSPSVMWLLQRMRNVVKKFYWNHICDHRTSIQCIPVLRLHSARIQPVPLKKRMKFRVGWITGHNRHQNHSEYCHLAPRRVLYMQLQGAREERMTAKHHTSLTPLLHFSIFVLNFADIITLLVVETNG
jgi:hypothetical protein